MLSASEAEGLARSFTSPYPNFMKTMKRFNVSGSYTLVSGFLLFSFLLSIYALFGLRQITFKLYQSSQ